MNKHFLKSSSTAAFFLALSSAVAAQSVTITHPNGVVRTIDCNKAFYTFKNDPKKKLWFTCDGFEMADIPVGGDKADPNNRDNICSITDKYDPNAPIKKNDPKFKQARIDFSTAAFDAILHGSIYHNNSVTLGINITGRSGADPFVRYKRIIAPADKATADDSFKDKTGKEIYYTFTNGLTKEAANWSPYRDATLACIAVLPKNE